MAFASDSTTAPARPLLPLLALDRRAIGRDGWARARELASRLGGEIRDHVAEGMRQAWAAARGLLEAAASATAASDASALASESVAAASASDNPAQSRSVDQIGTSDVVLSYPDHGGVAQPLLPLPAPLPPLTAALSRRRAIFRAVAADEPDAAAPPPHRDSLDAIRWELDGLLANVPALAPVRPPASLERATTLWRRQALERAVEHGAAVLDALGLPRLVGPDHIVVDPVAAGNAMDAAIAALDALDGDPDLEPSLGYYTPGYAMDGEAEPEHDEDDGITEPSLASPERHPTVPWSGNHFRHYITRERQDTQARWADGGRQDTEGDIVDQPHDGENEDLEAEPAEHSLGAPAGDGDQRHWAQGYDNDREADPCDGPGLYLTAEKRQAARDRRPELHALAGRARALRGGQGVRRDPDLVTMIGPGRMAWGGPALTRDGYPVVGTVGP